jgi:hypothetical protein
MEGNNSRRATSFFTSTVTASAEASPTSVGPVWKTVLGWKMNLPVPAESKSYSAATVWLTMTDCPAGIVL